MEMRLERRRECEDGTGKQKAILVLSEGVNE